MGARAMPAVKCHAGPYQGVQNAPQMGLFTLGKCGYARVLPLMEARPKRLNEYSVSIVIKKMKLVAAKYFDTVVFW
jgi:hypothetical protein